MKKTYPILFALLLFFSLNTFASIPVSPSLAPMLKKALPAVVNIRAPLKITDLNTLNRLQKEKAKEEGNNGDSNAPVPDKVLSVASGVIVDADKGYILTNAHVINEAQNIVVTLSDGHHYTAKMIGMDKASDIALLQIHAKNLTAIPVADSNSLKVGDVVAAIGNPFGLNQTVTSGIISALGRTTLGIENYENFIQTDAPINPGNSGGALINTEGQLIGINTAILAPDRGSIGIGFAIPSNMAKSVMQQLIQYGNVKRGVLGVGAQDITPDLASAFNLSPASGAVVTLVVANSPAQNAGLQVGDIMTAIDGTEVKNANDVINVIGFLRVDSKIKISILRKNKSQTLTATLSDPQKRQQENQEKNPFLYGVALKDFTAFSPVHGDIKGILVVTVDEESNAWRSDLRPGDIITSANQEKVTSVAELQKVAADSKNLLLVNVLRGPTAFFLVISPEQ